MAVAYKAAEAQDPPGVATVGSLSVKPNSPSIVPGEVIFTLDLSHPDKARLDAMEKEFRQAVAAAGPGEVTASCEMIWDSPAVTFDTNCVATLTASAAKLGYRSRAMLSGAGHDAVNISKIAPTAMLFVPCHKGISHNEAEHIEPRNAAVGAEVLLNAVLELADN